MNMQPRFATPAAVDRDAIAERLDRLTEADAVFLCMMMDNPARDDLLVEGIHRALDLAATGRLLHSLKLEKRGRFFGDAAPARLQIRLMEAARSSQQAAYQAFRAGLVRSGGLARAFPKA